MSQEPPFAGRQELDIKEIETGIVFAPKFDCDGVLPAVATDADTGEVMMLAYMNDEALALTIKTGVAHYWSRSRKSLWRKGETSGNIQQVMEIRTDCDQDAIWIKVKMGGTGASCHLGYRSCFYRAITASPSEGGHFALERKETSPLFDPKKVYGEK